EEVASTLSGYEQLHSFDIPWFIAINCNIWRQSNFDYINSAETRGTIFGMDLQWPRFVRTQGRGGNLIVVFGSNPAETEMENLNIKLRGQEDGSGEKGSEEGRCRWTLWAYDHWIYDSEVRR
ncbi:hypothetical protein FRC04_007217, partial [Tulasnella sp. 424]